MTVVVIIGPSGAGKSSVAKVLQDTYGFHLEKTVTTRPQRDVFDTDQQFVDAKTFQKMLEAKAFFGTLEAFGFSYGLPRFNPDNSTVLLLRAPAVQEFLTKFPQARIIEIDALYGPQATTYSARNRRPHQPDCNKKRNGTRPFTCYRNIRLISSFCRRNCTVNRRGNPVTQLGVTGLCEAIEAPHCGQTTRAPLAFACVLRVQPWLDGHRATTETKKGRVG